MGIPGSFQLVNRALMYELVRPGMLRGKAKMYVDDMQGVCCAGTYQQTWSYLGPEGAAAQRRGRGVGVD